MREAIHVDTAVLEIASPRGEDTGEPSDTTATTAQPPEFTAAVTNPNSAPQQQPASAAELNRTFLEQVVVWPTGPGWINLHANMRNDDPKKNGGKPWVIGWPYKDINEFINQSLWI